MQGNLLGFGKGALKVMGEECMGGVRRGLPSKQKPGLYKKQAKIT